MQTTIAFYKPVFNDWQGSAYRRAVELSHVQDRLRSSSEIKLPMLDHSLGKYGKDLKSHVLEIGTVCPTHDQIHTKVILACLSRDEFQVKRQEEEFSNQPVDRTDIMVATGPLQTAVHNEPVPRKEGEYGKKSYIVRHTEINQDS